MTSELFVSVPQYYLQTDSSWQHQRDRMCFSSAVAMAVKFLKPRALLGVSADDDYLRTVLKFGDTTHPIAHQKAVRAYGLDSRFTTKGSFGDLQRILSEGRPVPVGFLHHGPPSAPAGGGHWALLVGLSDTHATFHDPYGELDNVRGGYPRPGIGGRNVRYTLRNWLPRWTHGGQAWLLDVFDPKAQVGTPVTPKAAQIAAYNGDWASVRQIAKQLGAVWPQVVAAQWALESGFGEHQSGKNNFYGIKGTPGTKRLTKEFIGGRFVTVEATFKDYPTPQASIEDLIRLWYKDYKGYRGVNRAPSWQACCKLLQQEGYATDPKYAGLLETLIRQND